MTTVMVTTSRLMIAASIMIQMINILMNTFFSIRARSV